MEPNSKVKLDDTDGESDSNIDEIVNLREEIKVNNNYNIFYRNMKTIFPILLSMTMNSDIKKQMKNLNLQIKQNMKLFQNM
jgi:hypothetical protein